MNYNDFINKQVINKNNEIGIVLSFDEINIVIKYPSEEKTYSPDVAFKTKFLIFKEDKLKNLIDQELHKKDVETQEKQNQIADFEKKYLIRKKKINETYDKLVQKNRTLLSLFGNDFIYPPLVEFEKKYKYYIDKRARRRKKDLEYLYGYHLSYYN